MSRRHAGASTRPDHPDPRLRGARLTHPFAEVWAAARRLARETPRWTIVSEDAGSGEIVAEATTPVWKFVDDVVVRVSLDAMGLTRVDVSSRSRVGRFDFGVNRRRIARYLVRLQRALPQR